MLQNLTKGKLRMVVLLSYDLPETIEVEYYNKLDSDV